MTNSTYTPSVHLFVDMDGTLVTWKQAACFEELLQENYFRDLPPYKEVVDAINWLNSTYPEIDVHILSAYMPENPYSVNEKNEWLDTYLPAIPKANRIFVPCGISKAEAAAKAIGESTINSSCILLDDYSVNLHDWKENGGGCIKNYKNVRLGLNVNGEIDSVKYPVDGIFNMDAMYDGYLDTWNIATRSEEERIEEFLEENDALLKNRDKIPFKYISDIHYGKKTVWKNPDFEN